MHPIFASLLRFCLAVPVFAQSPSLLPGEDSLRIFLGNERQVFEIVVEQPLWVRVDQIGLDLVLEARCGNRSLKVDAPTGRYGPEILVLDRGRWRLELFLLQGRAAAGKYRLRVGIGDEASLGAFRNLSLAGQLTARDGVLDAREAAKALRAARDFFAAVGEVELEAEAQTFLALTLSRARLPAGLELEQAFALWQALDRPVRAAFVLQRLGLAKGGNEGRLELEQAIQIFYEAGATIEEAKARVDLCLFIRAAECYQKQLQRLRAFGESSFEAEALNGLAGVYDGLGEPDLAIENYRQALALFRSQGDSAREAILLINLAVVHRRLGDIQEALSLYDQAIQKAEALGDQAIQGLGLNNLGFALMILGDLERAHQTLERALELRRRLESVEELIITLNNLGRVERAQGQVDSALERHRQALELAEKIGSSRQVGISTLRLGQALMLDPLRAPAERAEQSLVELERAEQLLLSDTRLMVELLGDRAQSLNLAGRSDEAEKTLRQVLDLARASRDRLSEAGALAALAALERDRGGREVALATVEKAVAVIEDLRQGLFSFDLRATFFATQRQVYALWLDLVADDPARAFAVSEKSRSRGLLEALAQPRQANANRRAEVRALQRRISEKVEILIRRSGLVEASALSSEIEVLRRQLDLLEVADQSEESDLSPADLAATLAPEDLFVAFVLAEPQSFALTVDHHARTRLERLPGEARLTALCRAVIEALSAGRDSDAALELSRELLAPIWPSAAAKRRLLLAPDGLLAALPFAALPAPMAPTSAPRSTLLATHELVIVPSARVVLRAADHQARRFAALIADPVFDARDPRWRGTTRTLVDSDGFERLPGSLAEAQAIRELAGSREVALYTGFAANRALFETDALGDVRFLHLATHGLVDTRQPELTRLALAKSESPSAATRQYLFLRDIYDLELDADLIVLSACETALGREVRGEGPLSLARAFMFAGAPRVLASLWKVPDRSTAALMKLFYRHLWQGGLPPSTALRLAQLELSRDPRRRHPHHWAGFVLHGDWRQIRSLNEMPVGHATVTVDTHGRGERDEH